MAKLKKWEADGKMVRIPIKEEEFEKIGIVAAIKGERGRKGSRWQIARWIREGLERDLPEFGKAVAG